MARLYLNLNVSDLEGELSFCANITHEGLILDVYDEDNDCLATAAATFDEMEEDS